MILAASLSAYGVANSQEVSEELLATPPAPLTGTQSGSEFETGVEVFVDGVVASYMQEERIAGVTVAVVKDANTVLLKGYGIASVDPERPVLAEQTLFRIGSISKTFLWVALMQLAEQGSISLDDPVNKYLPESLQVPDEGFSEPVRIWHLMTHTAGFEDKIVGHLFINDDDRLLPMHEYLAGFRPHRVRPPGDLTAYSNYGAALAGQVVTEVAGVDFEPYVQEHIFRPLGMTATTFREQHGSTREGVMPPMDETRAARLAEGLEWEHGAWKTQVRDRITHVAPAGSASSTAADMARFVTALLNDGQYGQFQLLQPETARKMRQVQFENAEGIGGPKHGFLFVPLPGAYENFGHGGATSHFQSEMVMVPELGLGIFISVNSAPGFWLSHKLPQMIVGQFFVEETVAATEPGPPSEEFIARAGRLTGGYRSTRRSYTSIEKIISLPSALDVSLSPDGYLLTSMGEEVIRWVEIEPLLFQEVGGLRRLAFRESEQGEITHVFPGYFAGVAGEKIGFFDSLSWFILVSVLTVLASIGMVISGWLRRKAPIVQGPAEKWAGWLMPALGLAWLLFLGLFTVAWLQLFGGSMFDPFPSPLMHLSLWVLVCAALLTSISVLSLYPVWRSASWPTWRRLRHTLAVLILVAMTLTLNFWNVLGFRYV